MRSEAGALGFTQEALKTSTTDGISKHLWILKKPSMYFSKPSGKRNGILIQESFLHVPFSFRSFCSALLKGNDEQSLEERRPCHYPRLRPE